MAVHNFSDVNECLMYPCQNGATCNNLDGSYECICAEGWTGVNCQIGMYTFSIDDCLVSRMSDFYKSSSKIDSSPHVLHIAFKQFNTAQYVC